MIGTAIENPLSRPLLKKHFGERRKPRIAAANPKFLPTRMSPVRVTARSGELTAGLFDTIMLPMKSIAFFAGLMLMRAAALLAKSVHDIAVKDIDGKDATLGAYKGKVLLTVNVASKCGLTPQYKALEAVHEKYKDKGFTVLGFPCNQFAGQEPGSNDEIKQFCSSKYSVTFPLFDKIDVNGANRHPLYVALAGKESPF